MLTHHQVLLRFRCNGPPKIDHSVLILGPFVLFSTQQLTCTTKTLLRSFEVTQDVLLHSIPEINGPPH